MVVLVSSSLFKQPGIVSIPTVMLLKPPVSSASFFKPPGMTPNLTQSNPLPPVSLDSTMGSPMSNPLPPFNHWSRVLVASPLLMRDSPLEPPSQLIINGRIVEYDCKVQSPECVFPTGEELFLLPLSTPTLSQNKQLQIYIQISSLWIAVT